MRKTLLTVLTLLCTFAITLGVGTACTSDGGNNSNSSSAQVETLKITGRPTDDTVTLTDAENTLTLSCLNIVHDNPKASFHIPFENF